jgi:Ca-activated chloride channel family protein
VHSGAEAIVENDLSVPEIFDTPEQEKQKAAAATAVAQLKDDISTGETRLRIIPLAEELLSGIQKIETLVIGNNVKGVEFYLNGKKIAIKRQPPYTLDLDFGIVPMVHKIKAVAIDEKGNPITGDDIVVNTGNDPFRVRIVQPRVAVNVKGPTRVEMSVKVPEGKQLGELQLYLNETRVATLYDEPFVQIVNISPRQGVGYLRAVATLKDDAATPPVEDVVMINTPAYMEQVDVHLIELPTTVIANGRPVIDLKEASFKVLDEGKPVKISKFEYVKNLPLSIGMAIDTSGSMLPRMNEAQKAAADFFQNVMKSGDKAFLVGFDSQPTLIQKWSPRIADVHAALARLRAEEYTALYDAVVYSLYNFLGTKGQKALIIVSDGQDTASKFTYDQALEYARRTGVPIYTIGLGIRSIDIDVRYKLGRFSSETGGAVYYIEKTEDLRKIYEQIQNELRSQYVLGFYPPEGVKSGSKWREVSVQVSEGKAKTIRGYYP